MSLKIGKHESFHIRTGWLRKGLKALEINNHIFLEDINAMKELGIGKNMVSSLRFWLQATGLTKEIRNSNSQKVQQKTVLADFILKYDNYFQDIGTFWLLHYYLIVNKDLKTVWNWFFNFFKRKNFTKKEFVTELEKYINQKENKTLKKRTLDREFNVFKRTYIYDPKINKNPEDTKLSPFRNLKYLIEKNNELYIRIPNKKLLSPKIIYYCIVDFYLKNNKIKDSEKEINSINIEDLLNNKNSVGNVFSLNLNILHEYLGDLQELGWIKMEKQAGLDYIKLKRLDKNNVIKKYYENLS